MARRLRAAGQNGGSQPTIQDGGLSRLFIVARRLRAAGQYGGSEPTIQQRLEPIVFSGPAASRRWAVRQLSADYTRRLPSCCSCGPAASRRWAVWRLLADYTTRRWEPTVCSSSGGCAPLDSTVTASSNRSSQPMTCGLLGKIVLPACWLCCRLGACGLTYFQCRRLVSMVQGVWKHGPSAGDLSSFQALVDQDEDTGRFGR